ncbi:LytR family transcriptional regulator [Dorea formicigenerans]|uniref:LytR family transcriptional regulator n=1 Tax=Dorea formicigenerans TaxID=39486 RepID=A0A413SIB9_9FIRM|nr:LytR family transcriptional regulator [Dorea formicigenerans]
MDRGPEQRRSEQRQSDRRESEQRRSEQRQSGRRKSEQRRLSGRESDRRESDRRELEQREASGKRRGRFAAVIIAGVAVLAVAGLGYVGIQKKKAAEAASAKATTEAEDSNTVTWQGKTYKYNQNLSNYLLLGVDKRTPAETRVGKADAGQADALFLLSLNRKTKEMTLISIPRDTMTDVESFDLEGKSLGKSKDHISLSYGYGDGGAESCKLTQEAVSNLFYGLPIQGYLAMNLDGIPELAKSVGGLTVTVPNNSLEYKYPEFAEGAEVTLTEENTETFVRSRDVDESQSAIYRMERQKAFLDAFSKKAKECYEQNAKFAANLFVAIKPYTVTNISEDRLMKLFQTADEGDGYTEWTVPGEGTQGLSYDEYQVDDDALYAKIMETFYQEVK